MFAALASLMNIGLALSDLGGAALSTFFDVRGATDTLPGNYAHLDTVMWIAVLSSFLPLPLLRFLPETRTSEEVGTVGIVGKVGIVGNMSPSGENPVAAPLEPEKREIV